MIRNQIQKGGYRWYLVLAKRGRERLAKDSLERKQFDVYLPMHAPTARSVNGRMLAQPRPFLPGYLFVSVDIAQPGWRDIFSAYGVQDVYCAGKGVERVPLAVPNSWIEQLQTREVNGLVVRPHKDQIKSAYEAGAPVRYHGVTCDLDAVFIEAVDAKRVAILVSLLGRDSRQIVEAKSIQSRS